MDTSSISINNNNHDYFSSLPHILLNKILLCKSLDNIDRICLSLTCKILFEERDRYFYFDINQKNYMHFDKFNNIKSYKEIIKKHLEINDGLLVNIKSKFYDNDDNDENNDNNNITVEKQPLKDKLKKYVNYTGEIMIDTDEHFIEPLDLSDFKFEAIYFYHISNSLKVKSFPPTMKLIYLGGEFDQQLEAGLFGDNVEEIGFGPDYDQPIAEGVLPSKLKKLEFGHSFNSPIAMNALPDSLEELLFNRSYNIPINYKLPKSLRYIRFGTIHSHFNQEIAPHTFPEGLRSIDLISKFDHPLNAGVLPSTLESLKLGRIFNQQLTTGTLPDSIKTLKFSSRCEAPIPNHLPLSLTTLVLSSSQLDFIDPTNVNLPTLTNLKKVKGFPIRYTHLLPKSVTTLQLDRREEDNAIAPGDIPSHVTKLYISSDEIGEQTLQPGLFPDNIVQLHINGIPLVNTSIFLPGVIPASVEVFEISNLQVMPSFFPSTIKHLRLWHMPCELEPDVLPPRLESLFMSYYDYPIGDNVLPHTLTNLDLGKSRLKKISKNAIRTPPPGEQYAKLNIWIDMDDFFTVNPPNDLPPSIFDVEIPYYNLVMRRIDNNWILPNM